jgi:BirA family transcriptional regulator, biotin operon repressor / biotin---[acetyl-CoA-carboxylase] ligase
LGLREDLMEFMQPQWHQRLASTNRALLEQLKNGDEIADGFVLAALEQTAGHGRLDHRWVSQAGRDLTFSFVWRPQVEMARLASLPMAAAVGVASALEAYEVQAQTKWPNDLRVGGRKISGILAESAKGGAVVVGIGLNVNASAEDLAQVGQPATSLGVECGLYLDVEAVLEQVLEALAPTLSAWQARGFAAIQAAWTGRCDAIGTRVEVGDGKARKQGIFVGLGESGQLLLGGDDGQVEEVWSGDLRALS